MWQAKPIKFIIELYPDHNNLGFKHATHQKADSLRAGFLSKVDKTVNNVSISNKTHAEFCTEWQVLLYYHNITCAYNYLFNLHQKSISRLHSIFTSLFHSYLFPKSSLQFPLKLTSSIPSNFSPPCFCVQLSQQSTPKILSLPYPFSQFRLREGTRKLGSLMRTDTVLISISFLKVCTVITGLTTTDPYRPDSENWCIAGSSL